MGGLPWRGLSTRDPVLVWRKGFAVQLGTVGSMLIAHRALYGPYGCKFYIPFGLRRGGRFNDIALT